MPLTYEHHCTLLGHKPHYIDLVQKSYMKFLIADPNCRLTQNTFKSKSAITAEIMRHVQFFPHTIHPFSRLRKYWEYLMIISFIFFYLCMPFRASFVFGRKEEVSSFPFIKELVIDIIMNFVTGSYNQHTDKINLSLDYIGKQYMKSFFIIDLLSSVPNNFMVLYLPMNEYHLVTMYDCITNKLLINDCLFDALDIIKYLKFFRLPTFFLYINNFFKRNHFRSIYFRFTRIIITMILVMHVSACSEFLIERIINGPDNLKDLWNNKEIEWNRTSSFEIYINSFYRSFYFVGNIGNELPEQNTKLNSIISTMFVIFGFIMNIYLISHAYMLMQIMYSASMKFQQNRYQLQEFMRYKQLPKDIQTRLLNYYDYRLQRQLYKESEIHKIVGTKLYEEVSYNSRLEIIKKVNFICLLPKDLIRKLAIALKNELYLKDDQIISPDQDTISMHIIVSGTVIMLNAVGEELSRFDDGTIFGELNLFNDTPTVFYAIALETTETYSLSKTDFLNVLNEVDPIYFVRAKLVAHNVIGLNEIFEDLINRVVMSTNLSATNMRNSTKSVASHVSLYQYNP
uniref:CSON011183 protein n=1 Tax=Culicoides sonorensis TaxID=179676 RepID=A0A336LQX6_CULSO